MADNFTANPGSAGDTFGADDIGGIKYPRSKLIYGPDNTNSGDVSLTNGLPVNVVATAGTVSTANSSSTPLGSSAAFTGTSENVTGYAMILVSVFADQASATDGLSIQQSSNGTNWDITDAYTIAASTGKTFSFQPVASFFRIVYTNGATIQTAFRLQAVFHQSAAKSSSQRPQDALSNENDFEQASTFPSFYNGTTWDRMRGDTTNGLDVDVTRLPALATGANTIGAVNIAAAQTLATVTTVGTVTNLTNWGNIVDNALFTDSTTRISMSGYVFDETAGTALTENDGAAARIDSKRAQVLVVEDATTRGQRQAVNTSGGASATLVGHTAGGHSIAKILSAASTNATNVKASAGQVYGWALFNTTASNKFFRLHNTAGSPTAGASVIFTVMIPANGGTNIEFTMGIPFATGIAYTIVGALADNDTTATAVADVQGVLLYK